MPSPRKSTRASKPPERYGQNPGPMSTPGLSTLPGPLPENIPLPSIEPPNTMSAAPNPSTVNLTQAELAALVAQAVQDALRQQSQTPQPPRGLTADLAPEIGYYVPVPGPSYTRLDPSKVRYPPLRFSDHGGAVDYVAWKLEMKYFIEEFAGNFQTDQEQVRAYFKATEGKAKKLITDRLDPEHPMALKTATEVLQALDNSFCDFNERADATTAYDNLTMAPGETYQQFQGKFTFYAGAARVPEDRWFDDLAKKVSVTLQVRAVSEKYKMNKDFAVLNNFFSTVDRELNQINRNRELKQKAVKFADKHVEKYVEKSHGILKTDNWRARSPSPSRYDSGARSPARSPTTPPIVPVAPVPGTPYSGTCFTCRKGGHTSKDCPDRNLKALAAIDLDADGDEQAKNF
jgi:hypothetical protein